MAIKLKCPNCRERLFADESDRGGFVKCDGCDTRVPVPADGSSPTASGTTKIPPAAPAAKSAPVVPVLKPIPAKAVVNAGVVTAAPVKPKTATAIPTVAPLAAPAKPKRRAEEEDDDLDDRPRRRAAEEEDDDTPPAKGGKGLLYVILGVGVLLLAGIGVGVFFLLQDDTPTEPGAYFAKKPNGMPDDWEAFNGEGVSCHVPTGEKKQTPTQINGFDGTWLTATDAKTGVAVDVITLNLGVDPEPKSDETVRFAFGYLDPLFSAPKSTAGGRVVDEITPPTGGPADTIWYHTTGDKAHILRLRQTVAQPTEVAVAQRDHFFTKAEFSGTVRPNAKDVFGRAQPPSRNPKAGEPPQRAWQVFAAPAASGFSVQAPGGAGMTAAAAKFRPSGAGFGREIEGKVYEVADGIFSYRVYHVDVPDGQERNPQEYIKQAHKPGESLDLDPTVTEDVTVNGLAARRWRVRHPGSRCNVCCLTVAHESRLFILTALVPDAFGAAAAREPFLLGRAKKFFASLKVTYDPKNYDPTEGQPAWVPMPDTAGFTAVAPPGGSKRPYSQPFGQGRELFERAVGFDYSVSDPDVKYQVVRVSLAVGRDPLAAAAALLPDGGKVLSGPTAVTVKGIAGKDSTVTDRSEHLVRVRTFTTGNTVLMASVTANRATTHPDRLLQFKADKFFAGLTVDAVTALPSADAEWADVPKPLGFTAKGPNRTKVSDYQAIGNVGGLLGKRYELEDEVAKYHVHVLPLGPKSDPMKALEYILRESAFDKVVEGPNKIRHDGLEGEETTVSGFGGEKARRRVFLTPVVLYVIRVETKRGEPDAEAAKRAEKFFASFKFTAGAVAPGGTVNVGNGEFASAGKVQPFWAAVVLPGKKELLTLGARNPTDLNPGGVLRRYSYPDFKLKATYHLPLPVNRAAADEKSGKLICSAISMYKSTLDQREAVSWTADLQLFDLTKILDGSLAEAEEIKPLKRLTVGQPISGLEADPLGGYAYAAVVVLPPPVKGRPLPATGRLYKIDLSRDAFLGNPINHREPLDGLRLSATGKVLVTSETAVAAPPPGKLFNLVVVNAIAWKIDKLIPVSAPAKDLTFTGEDVVALVPADKQNKVFALAAAANEAVDVTPKDLALEGFGYLRVTADGKRAVGSAGVKQNGLLLANVTGSGEKAKFAKVTSGTTVATAPTGGHFVLTPDGKFAVFNTGAVVDLERTTAPKE